MKPREGARIATLPDYQSAFDTMAKLGVGIPRCRRVERSWTVSFGQL